MATTASTAMTRPTSTSMTPMMRAFSWSKPGRGSRPGEGGRCWRWRWRPRLRRLRRVRLDAMIVIDEDSVCYTELTSA